MNWIICLVIGSVVLPASVIAAIALSKSKRKVGRVLSPLRVLILGVVVSAVALFIPIYWDIFKNENCGAFETFLISVHNMIRLFIVDGEFSFVTENISAVPDYIFRCYTFIFSILFVLAPVLTFGFVLSLFRNISAYIGYVWRYNSEKFIFSQLNEKSLTLAEDLMSDKSKKRCVVFTDVKDTADKRNSDLCERAKELGALCFTNDILSVNFSAHNRQKARNFFTIGEDQESNVSNTLKIIQKFKHEKNTNLYFFSTTSESEHLLANAFENTDDCTGKKSDGEKKPVEIRLRRINEVKSLINRTLYDDGYKNIFESALPAVDGIRKINAVIVGMGQHGTEMTKALSWFCQMDGYHVEINTFDMDEKADEKFTSICPELMDEKLNGRFDIDGESKCKITVHPGINVETSAFDKMIDEIPEPTYVFVCLGNDEKNINTAVKIRTLLLRRKCKPIVQAVVYSSEKKKVLEGLKNYRGQCYEIDFAGDIKSSYSEKVILDLDVEAKALERHMKWGDERAFWQYSYNYNSSIASAIHTVLKEKCKIPGVGKSAKERTEEELWAIRKLEHCRWNAYMRSEGYVYGGTVEKEGRNDLAKMHNCLVPFDKLPLAEQIKDDD